jgi:transcription-repair coupling factor (superfamily II helicase)
VRESQAGHAFGPDTPWQREFESAFLYEETPDQWRAIQETKADMERPKPMDRLICGDVGFGKTEVAIRAAFKAVMGGKQVAVLVPTTVLAQQHFHTLRERMADYPVRIELLSRFRSRRDQARVLGELARGAVDIVVGTHRLVQPDVVFKDLGLVVIDEEQRFGVLHKERFKRLRALVDVLTLSATPIPRTLYLALTGARDMSTIQTPPQDRLPVETIVTGYDERVIRDAIQRELNRGGQVFFLHNRVSTIEVMAQKLRALVPHARIVVGHGQMHSDELEAVMTRFVNGEADVLLSTTIIESGLDIPNANTIIIDRADRFGLSELYQLRGRVGRYKHQAYAYLLLPRHAGLLSDARKRIAAMKQYSTLGAGFKIAMRDLEIRGAGNLLGAEQSGHITAVGFELYCQLLQQSIASLKGERIRPRVEVAVRLDFLNVGGEEDMMSDACSENLTHHASRITNHATLPHAYITEPRQRIEIYRKLALARDRAELTALQREVRDRFGPLPPAAERLFLLGDLKLMAAERGVTSIEVEEDKLKLKRAGDFIQVGRQPVADGLRLRMPRGQFQHALIMEPRPVAQPQLLRVDVSQRQVGRRVGRVGGQHALQLRHGVGRIAVPPQRQREVVARRHVVGAQRHRRLRGVQRLEIPARLQGRRCVAMVRVKPRRVGRRRLGKRSRRQLIPPRGHGLVAAGEQRGGTVTIAGRHVEPGAVFIAGERRSRMRRFADRRCASAT